METGFRAGVIHGDATRENRKRLIDSVGGPVNRAGTGGRRATWRGEPYSARFAHVAGGEGLGKDGAV